MRTTSTRTGCLAGILLIAFAMANPAGAQQAKDKLSFRLDWSINGFHAPVFLALERGYYAQEGIDLKVSEGQGSGTVLKLIAQGTDPIGLSDYQVMTKAVVQGLPVKAIFGITQNNPMVIVSHADNPIKTPQELVGKMIAMAPAESTALLFPALLAASGVDAGKISVVNPAFSTKITLFRQKRVDGITAAIDLQPPQLEVEGYKLQLLRYADYGLKALSIGVVVNTSFLSANGDLVKRFLRATTRGWEETLKDPDAAVEATIKSYPYYREQKKVMLAQLEVVFKNLHTPNSQGKPLGWMAKGDWEESQQLLVKYLGLEKQLPIEQYYTNDFIP